MGAVASQITSLTIVYQKVICKINDMGNVYVLSHENITFFLRMYIFQ